MDGEARRARREARRPELRLAAGAARLALAALVAACASVGDPPGGPPRTTPPAVTGIFPDSGAVVPPPREADIYLDEVVQERVAAPRPDISSAVLLSPVKGTVDVGWHRNRISVRPHEGFKAGRVYRLELFPVLTDLRQNKMKRGRVWVFSTGPAIPSAELDGAVADWAAGRPGVNALVEAMLLPDSLPYRTLADSSGSFALRQLPPGDYLVYGVIDQNNDRQLGPREAFDTVRVHLADTASVEVYAFPHDTVPPRLRTTEIADSVTLRLTFDRPLDPALHLDTSAMRFALASDSTTPLAVAAVWTQAQADSVRTAAAAQRAAADSARLRRQLDSARTRPPGDTTRGRLPGDTARARPPAPGQPPPPGQAPRPRAGQPAVPPPPLPIPGAPGQVPGPPGQGPGAGGRAVAPRDSSRAMKMLARRPPPSAVRLIRLEAPLIPGSRYLVRVTGARALYGISSGVLPGQVAVPVPRAPARGARQGAADSLGARGDTTAQHAPPADTTAPPAAVPRDTTRHPAPFPPRDTTRTPPPTAPAPTRTPPPHPALRERTP